MLINYELCEADLCLNCLVDFCVFTLYGNVMVEPFWRVAPKTVAV